ncbi:hypothetical protein AAFC00_000332 [Neodothiora populina]|uniref:BTB domain-containing protein n=1 Tax=Neodothiora populina TaxID=2781224 RepID=A0ABR3PD46_9PEZI
MNLLARFLHTAAQSIETAPATTTTLPERQASTRKRKRSVDTNASSPDNASCKRVLRLASPTPPASTPPEDLPNPEEDYGDHHWQSHVVRISKLIALSTETIPLISERGTRKFFVHKELLAYYSSHYRAILNSPQPCSDEGLAKGSRYVIVKTTQAALAIFTKWLYTRDLSLPDKQSLGASFISVAGSNVGGNHDGPDSCPSDKWGRDLLHLYLFASMTDMLSLQRDVMDALQSLHQAQQTWFPDYGMLEHLYFYLPPESPILGFLVDVFVSHGPFGTDEGIDERAPREFLFAVITGQAKRVKILRHGLRESQLMCCGEACAFHCHENARERAASACYL